MKIFLLLILFATPLTAHYLAPSEQSQLFRRDAIALNPDRQRLLSRSLISLAARPSTMANPAQRRATAQLLALAHRLDPKSPAPARMSATFESEGPKDARFLSEDPKEHFDELSQTILFLLNNSDSSTSQTLAHLLLDPLSTIAPELSVIKTAHNPADEEQRWAHTVAPLNLFLSKKEINQKKALATSSKPNKSTETTEKSGLAQPTKTPERETSQENALKVKPYRAGLFIPALSFPEGEKNAFIPETGIYEFRLKSEKNMGRHSGITVQDKLKFNNFKTSRQLAEQTIQNETKQQLLEKTRGNFSAYPTLLSPENDLSLSFPMAILLEGSLSHREPIPGLTVLGEISSEGLLVAPARPWKFLEILLSHKNEKTRRLILPKALYPYLTALLAEEREDFFFQYDIFCVETLEEAFEFSFPGSLSPQASEALATFQEIRLVGQNQASSTFVSNSHVINRLKGVKAIDPRLASASVLLEKRPTHLSSQIFASRIHFALEPLAKFPGAYAKSFKPGKWSQSHDLSLKRLEPLSRITASSERSLYRGATGLVEQAGLIARTLSKGNDVAKREKFEDFQDEHYKLFTKLAALTGEPAPLDPRN